MKVLILTRILNEHPEETKLIQQSNIVKIAVNHAPVKSDYRVLHDYDKFYEYDYAYKEKLVTLFGGMLRKEVWMYYKIAPYPSLYDDRNDIIQDHKRGNVEELYFNGSSIVPAIDLAIRLGASEILIVGDNTVHGFKLQERNKEAVNKLKVYCNLFCFKAENNFGLPYKNLAEFLKGE